MTRNTLRILFAASLVAGIASCKKKDGDAGSSSSAAASSSPSSSPASSSTPAAAPAAASSGIPECDAYVKAMEKFTKCDKLPPEQQQAYASQLEKDRQSYLDAKDKAATATQCTEAMNGLAEGAKARGCTL